MRYKRLLRRALPGNRITTRQTCTVLLVFTVIVTLLLCHDEPTFGYDEATLLKLLSKHPLLNWTRTVHTNSFCRIPSFRAFSNEILPYFKLPPEQLRCKNREAQLSRVHIDTNRVEISESASAYNCFIEDVVRDGDNAVRFENERRLEVGWNTFEAQEGLQAIRVSCKNFLRLPVYSHIHLVRPKFVPHGPRNDSSSSEAARNVLLFGIDSVSNLAAVRLLPNTFLYLLHNLSAVVLNSHHKVGENTFPNLITILSGEKRTHPADTKTEKDQFFDSWPLIWKKFSEIGYETFYGEDFPQVSTFNLFARGFEIPPTDHYLRPFWVAIRDSKLFAISSNLCYGALPKYQLHLDYLEAFLRAKRDHPYFALSFLVEISHEYQELLGAADNAIVKLLEAVRGQVLAGETILIFFSDHGHRFDSIRQTRQGHFEERLPFVAIATANATERSVLRHNSQLLTSHYDLFETVRSLLPRAQRPPASRFGIDLLSEKIAQNRTCSEAGVLDFYCTCDSRDSRDVKGISDGFSDVEIQYAAKTVDFINSMLKDEPTCARLELRRVVSTFVMGQENVFTLETSPGGAIFEVRFTSFTEELREEQLSRINRYGKPCIPSQVLRKYCFCDS